jgi:hypothetical protein
MWYRALFHFSEKVIDFAERAANSSAELAMMNCELTEARTGSKREKDRNGKSSIPRIGNSDTDWRETGPRFDLCKFFRIVNRGLGEGAPFLSAPWQTL